MKTLKKIAAESAAARLAFKITSRIWRSTKSWTSLWRTPKLQKWLNEIVVRRRRHSNHKTGRCNSCGKCLFSVYFSNKLKLNLTCEKGGGFTEWYVKDNSFINLNNSINNSKSKFKLLAYFNFDTNSGGRTKVCKQLLALRNMAGLQNIPVHLWFTLLHWIVGGLGNSRTILDLANYFYTFGRDKILRKEAEEKKYSSQRFIACEFIEGMREVFSNWTQTFPSFRVFPHPLQQPATNTKRRVVFGGKCWNHNW